MFNALLSKIRAQNPLVVCVTNHVTMNVCANILLEVGGSPIMAEDEREMAELVGMADALCVNIGTLHESQISAMLVAADTAKKRGIPALLDPVGVGASSLRMNTARQLLATGAFQMLRGNLAEFQALTTNARCGHGVDTGVQTGSGGGLVQKTLAAARNCVEQYRCTASISGETDVIYDGVHSAFVRNGVPELPRITGSGCMLSAMTAAFMAVCDEIYFEAALESALTMGIAGEVAVAKMRKNGESGLGTFRMRLHDALSVMTDADLERMANCER